jgi:hypothetical protein
MPVCHQWCLPFTFCTDTVYPYLISHRRLLCRNFNINFIQECALLCTYLPAFLLSFLPPPPSQPLHLPSTLSPYRGVPWVWRLIAVPSPAWRSEFDLRTSHLRFAVTAVALVQTFLQIFYAFRRCCRSTVLQTQSPICHWCCMLLAVHSVATKNAFNVIPNEWLKRERENAAAVCLNDIVREVRWCVPIMLSSCT